MISSPIDDKKVGRRLVKLRHLLGFGYPRGGQREFAEKFGFSPKNWSAYETGETLIPLREAVRLIQSELLEGITLDWIYLDRWRDLPFDLRRRLVDTPDDE